MRAFRLPLSMLILQSIAAKLQDIMFQENKRKRERAFQGGSVEPGRSRGLRNGECDPLELAWCTPMNPQ